MCAMEQLMSFGLLSMAPSGGGAVGGDLFVFGSGCFSTFFLNQTPIKPKGLFHQTCPVKVLAFLKYL